MFLRNLFWCVRDEKFGNCDDSSTYTRVQSLEHSLILKHSCSSASEFCDVSAAEDIIKPENVQKTFIEQVLICQWLLLKIKHLKFNCMSIIIFYMVLEKNPLKKSPHGNNPPGKKPTGKIPRKIAPTWKSSQKQCPLIWSFPKFF